MTPTENVDPAEIAKFDEMAHRWWDPEGEFKPLHEMNPIRANYIDARAGIAEKTVIDVGCGGGLLSEALAHRGAKVTGIDMAESPLEIARLHMLESQLDIHYEHSSAELYAERHPAAFDVVTCMELLEHVPDPQATINACAQLTQSGGDVFFSTINRNPLSYMMAVIGAEYVMQMLPKGTHDYQKFIRPSELTRWGRAAGLLVSDISGVTYNPVNRKFRLNPENVNINYMIHFTKP